MELREKFGEIVQNFLWNRTQKWYINDVESDTKIRII